MNELLNSPEFQRLAPYMPYLMILAVLQVVSWVLLANSIRKVLLMVREENRMMIPSYAFLIAMPLLNIYWTFMVVKHLKDSLNNEFYDRKVAVEVNPTQKEGRLFAWSFLFCNIPLPMFIGYSAIVLNIIGFILYWVKVVEYNKILKATSSYIAEEEQETED